MKLALAALVVAAALAGVASAAGDAAAGVEWTAPTTVERLDGAAEAGAAAKSRSVFARAEGDKAEPQAEASPAAAGARFAERRTHGGAGVAFRAGSPPRFGWRHAGQEEGAAAAQTPEERFAERRRRRRRGFFKSVGKLIKNGVKSLRKLTRDPKKNQKPAMKQMKQDVKTTRAIEGEDIEDCVGCQFVWRAVELDVGNTAIKDDIYDSFSQQCIQAEKTKIFYPACEAMFHQVEDMISDYLSGTDIIGMCSKAGLGCEGDRLPGRAPAAGQEDTV